MPMPPPKASTGGRAGGARGPGGPRRPDVLARLVGAGFWEADRFDRALAFAVADGLVYRTSDGAVAASG